MPASTASIINFGVNNICPPNNERTINISDNTKVEKKVSKIGSFNSLLTMNLSKILIIVSNKTDDIVNIIQVIRGFNASLLINMLVGCMSRWGLIFFCHLSS